MIADGAGRAVAFALAPGQAHELPHAVPLLARLPGVPLWVVADRGYSSHAFREHIWDLGARPAISTRRSGTRPRRPLQPRQSPVAPSVAAQLAVRCTARFRPSFRGSGAIPLSRTPAA